MPGARCRRLSPALAERYLPTKLAQRRGALLDNSIAAVSASRSSGSSPFTTRQITSLRISVAMFYVPE
ncbi:MAG: hypothetical protein K0R58_219 [Ramlibacter sp.]|jgi:hypothetical protein|nr:hypothetical protein [Ramlibacter sp.]